MKSLENLHTAVLRNLGEHCSVAVDKDIEYMSCRVEHEGEEFLTISLPSFAKALERGLHEGHWPITAASSFKVAGHLPSFLRGFVMGVFSKSGELLENPDPEKIWAVRQFCYLTHKVERPCSDLRIQKAFDTFVSTDRELVGLPMRIDRTERDRFYSVARSMFGELFQHCDNLIANWELVPKHGPGAVAESLSPLKKWEFGYWTERLETVFPYWRYTQNLPSVYSHGGPVPLKDEMPVRVISVPKTQSTPRIIAIEPSSIQYAQQALKRAIYEFVGSSKLAGIIGFADQSRNQKMAHKASISGEFATLDLSEASDRVHWWLVDQMLMGFPHLREYVMAVRTNNADVPGHGVLPLFKYASMGSALTFPIEAMVFATIAAMVVSEADGNPAAPSYMKGRLSVYGDDIIVPTYMAARVIEKLEYFGAQVNRHKSFWRGNFRESCGKEYYAGHDVSVVRLRDDIPRSRRDATELASFVDFRNRLFEAGLWSAVRKIDPIIEGMIKFEPAEDTSAFLVKRTFLPVQVEGRWNEHLHRHERKLPYLHGVSRKWALEGEVGLWKWFTEASDYTAPRSRYDSQERSAAFSIYSRWSDTR